MLASELKYMLAVHMRYAFASKLKWTLGICIWQYTVFTSKLKYSLLLSIWLFAKHLSHKLSKLWTCAFGSMYTLRVVNCIIFWVYVFGCTPYSKRLSKLNNILGFCLYTFYAFASKLNYILGLCIWLKVYTVFASKSKYGLLVNLKMKSTQWFTHHQAILAVHDFLLSDKYHRSSLKKILAPPSFIMVMIDGG